MSEIGTTTSQRKRRALNHLLAKDREARSLMRPLVKRIAPWQREAQFIRTMGQLGRVNESHVARAVSLLAEIMEAEREFAEILSSTSEAMRCHGRIRDIRGALQSCHRVADEAARLVHRNYAEREFTSLELPALVAPTSVLIEDRPPTQG